MMAYPLSKHSLSTPAHSLLSAPKVFWGVSGGVELEVAVDHLVMTASFDAAKQASPALYLEELRLMELGCLKQIRLSGVRCCGWRYCLFSIAVCGE